MLFILVYTCCSFLGELLFILSFILALIIDQIISYVYTLVNFSLFFHLFNFKIVAHLLKNFFEVLRFIWADNF